MRSIGKLIKYECCKLYQNWFFVAALLFGLLISLLYQEEAVRRYRFWYDTDERRELWAESAEMEPEEALEWASGEHAWYLFLAGEKMAVHTEEDTLLSMEIMKEGLSFEWQAEFDRRWRNVGEYPQEELTLKLYGNIYGFLSNQMEYIRDFEEWLATLRSQIEASEDNPLIDRSGFAYRSSRKRLEELEKLSGMELARDYPLAVGPGTEASIPDLFVPMLVVLAAWLVSGTDKEQGTEMLFGCTRNGRRALAAARAAACLIHAVSAAFLLYGGSFLFTVFSCGGMGKLDVPIQSLREFRDCRYVISAGEYLAAYFGMKLTGAVLFALLALAVCAVFRRTVWFLPAYGAALWGEYWLSGRDIWWNLFSFQDVELWFRTYRDLNVLDRPVDPAWGFLLFFLLAFLVLGSIYMACSGGRPAAGIWRPRFLRGRVGRNMDMVKSAAGRWRPGFAASLFFHESYKLYVLGGGGICLIFLLLYGAVLSESDARYSVVGTESIYNYYIYNINGGFYGEYTEEAAERLQDFKDWFAWEDEEALEMEVSYGEGFLSLTEYEDWKLFRQALQIQYKEAFRLILDQEEAVRKAQARAGEFHPEKCGFVSLYLEKGLLEDYREQILLYLLLASVLCVTLPVIHAQEAESGMEILLRTAGVGRRKSESCKRLHCFLFTTGVFLLTYLPYLAWQWRRYEPTEGGMEGYIQCVCGYEEFPWPLTLGGAFLVLMAVRYISTCLMAVCLTALGKWSGSRQTGRIAGCLLFLTPGILYLTGVDVSPYTMPGGYLLPALWGGGGWYALSGYGILCVGIGVLLVVFHFRKGARGYGVGN